MQNNIVVKIDDLLKRYGDLIALDHFSMEIKQGEIFGLLGPNGSGKTSAINCMLSLLNYNSGEINIFGEKMKPTAYDIKNKIGLVPQEISIVENLTVYENIDYFCGLYISDRKKRKELVEEVIDFVKLNSHRKFMPSKLSGGLKRRLNIACGIAHKPELIILDEPTVAIDAQSRNFILEGIKDLNKNGSTILYTSHYLEEVEQVCDRILIMDKGVSIAKGTKEELVDLLPVGNIVEIEFVDAVAGERDKAIEGFILEIKEMDEFLEVTEEKNIYKFSFKHSANNVEKFISYLSNKALAYKNLRFTKPSLNDVFLQLTGKELRE